MARHKDKSKRTDKIGRPRKELHDRQLEIVLSMISAGFPDSRVLELTTISSRDWNKVAKEGRTISMREADGSIKAVPFAKLLETAEINRGGNLSREICLAMLRGIQKGNPYFIKLAIHNFPTGFKDPDVETTLRIKRMLEEMQHEMMSRLANVSDYAEPNRSMASVKFPSVVVPHTDKSEKSNVGSSETDASVDTDGPAQDTD